MSSLWLKLKDILPSTSLLVNGWFRLSTYLTNYPTIIGSLVKLYYEQKDEFIASPYYNVSNYKQTAERRTMIEGVCARIITLNTIDYQFVLKQETTQRWKWTILIDDCPERWHAGIIDKSKLNDENQPNGSPYNYIGFYGLRNSGEAIYLCEPPLQEMKPINHVNKYKKISTGDMIVIELYISKTNAHVKFYINDNHILTYPWIDSLGKYVLFISVRDVYGQFKMIKYENEML